MSRFNIFLSLLISSFVLLVPILSSADETDLFSTAIPPDALIILDRSGSMADTPSGGRPTRSGSDCLQNPGDDCSKMDIAKAAIFNIMDYVKNGTVNLSDSQGMNVRFGYMRYTEAGGSSCSPEIAGNYNYSNGCNQLIDSFEDNSGVGSYYQTIICGNTNKNGSCTLTGTASGDSVLSATASGGTPLAASLAEGLLYMNYSKSHDSKAGDCRKKFIILITDGEDTYACNGNGVADEMYNPNMNWRRQSVVSRAKALYDAGYMVYVIGFGAGQSTSLQRTLNWAAYFGGSDNPTVANTGDPSAYTPPTITPTDNTCTGTDDPGFYPLDGYAFIATNTADLSSALQSAISQIREASYSFSEPYIALSRTADENYVYQASFTPYVLPNDPFWEGHLARYTIDSQGNVSSTPDWDAGSLLAALSGGSRSMKTLTSGNIVNFLVSETSITNALLGVSDSCSRTLDINYIRGMSSLPRDYNNSTCQYYVSDPDNRKLGDIFGSNLMILGTPYESFSDIFDLNNAFATYRNNNQRTTPNGKRLILAGANDGQLHAFFTNNGAEAWSFIPPNSLPNLINIAHSTHPTSKQHTYMVDGPITTSDVWLCPNCDNTHKQVSDWHSYIVFGLGKGNKNYLWSSVSTCDSSFATAQGKGGTEPPYSSLYKYYCGYYALEDTYNATAGNQAFDGVRWRILTENDPQDAPYLGQPWSKMQIVRVKINGQEKWVGFIGGGYNSVQPQGQTTSDNRGRGIFVIDMSDGHIIKAFTLGGNNPTTDMIYAIPAPPMAVDTDADAYTDRVYVGDLGGNMWRLRLCGSSSGASCNESNWTASKLYDATSSGNIRPIYTSAVVAYDNQYNLWVFWGTGDIVNPTDANAQEQFYAVKDGGGTYGFHNLDNVDTGTYNGTSQGWVMLLQGQGEKMLGSPAILNGNLYFTTYTPVQGGGSNLCSQGGSAALYGLDAGSAAGILGTQGNTRSETLSGSGVASAPFLSIGPDGSVSLFVSQSGANGTGGNIEVPPGANARTPVSMRNVTSIRDLRAQ